jgi:hypothetical protein
MLFSEYIFFPRRFDFMIWQEMICIQFLICWFRFYMYVIWFLFSLGFYYLTYDVKVHPPTQWEKALTFISGQNTTSTSRVIHILSWQIITSNSIQQPWHSSPAL